MIARVLAEATDYMACEGVGESRLDAEVLLAHVLGVARSSFYVNPEQPLTPEQESRYWDLVRRRGAGEPLAYLCGEKEFYSLPFLVDRSVLIPRPETEQVVEAALESLRRVAGGGRVPAFFDVGTGSGAIAVAVLFNLPGCRGWAGDVSAAALRLARRNAERHGVADRLTWIAGDLFGGFGGRVDVVVSNPPYVSDGESAMLPRDVRNFEPPEALFAGPDGLTIIRRLTEQSPSHLAPDGRLILEIGYSKGAAVRRLFELDARWADVEIRDDLAGIPRVVIARVGQVGNLPKE